MLEEVTHRYRCQPGSIARLGAGNKVSMPSSNVFSEQGVVGRQMTLIRTVSDGISLMKFRF